MEYTLVQHLRISRFQRTRVAVSASQVDIIMFRSSWPQPYHTTLLPLPCSPPCHGWYWIMAHHTASCLYLRRSSAFGETWNMWVSSNVRDFCLIGTLMHAMWYDPFKRMPAYFFWSLWPTVLQHCCQSHACEMADWTGLDLYLPPLLCFQRMMKYVGERWNDNGDKSFVQIVRNLIGVLSDTTWPTMSDNPDCPPTRLKINFWSLMALEFSSWPTCLEMLWKVLTEIERRSWLHLDGLNVPSQSYWSCSGSIVEPVWEEAYGGMMSSSSSRWQV